MIKKSESTISIILKPQYFKLCFCLADPIFSKIAFTDKKTSVHSRIIWAASWSHDSKYFITASRDKKLVIWGSSGEATSSGGLGNYGAVTKPLDLGDAVTAVDFAPIKTKDGRLVF